MGETKFFDQALQALRFFQRVQVFALHVLDQRHGSSGLVGHVAHQHRRAIEPGELGRAETPLARNDFVDRARRAFGAVQRGVLGVQLAY